MAVYLGARNASQNIDLGTIPGESTGQMILLAVEDAPENLFTASAQIQFELQSITSQNIDWLADKLKSYLIQNDSEEIASSLGKILYFAQKDNRAFLTALIKDGLVKAIKTDSAKGALFFMELESELLDQDYPFKDFIESATTVWLRLVNWSSELTPIQQAAAQAAENSAKATNTFKGMIKSWPFLDILMIGTIDKIQCNLEHQSVEWLMEHWINDAFKVIAITALVSLTVSFKRVDDLIKIGEAIVSKAFINKFFAHWIVNSLAAGFISWVMDKFNKEFKIGDRLSKSTLAQVTYQKAATAYEAISNSNMIQMIQLLMKDVQNPQTIKAGLDSTDWANTVTQDYQNQAVPSSSIIPRWTNPGEGGI